ncbi:phosphotransferase [Nonomuraea sp. B12E4]|uniref:phosphotransferase n=1 Tax=Nonomuraea sp. B12E4 TaxID=3153564 RepID=UPI00325DC3B8
MTGTGPAGEPHGVVPITGVSAAGKSSVAQAPAERLPRAAHVRGDAFRRMVVSGRAEMTPDPSDEAVRRLRLRYLIAANTADLYYDAGFAPIVQDIIFGPDLERFTKLIVSRPPHVAGLAPGPATVARRERARNKVEYSEMDDCPARCHPSEGGAETRTVTRHLAADFARNGE